MTITIQITKNPWLQNYDKVSGIWITWTSTFEWVFDGYSKEFYTETCKGISITFHRKFPFIGFVYEWQGWIMPEGRNAFD